MFEFFQNLSLPSIKNIRNTFVAASGVAQTEGLWTKLASNVKFFCPEEVALLPTASIAEAIARSGIAQPYLNITKNEIRAGIVLGMGLTYLGGQWLKAPWMKTPSNAISLSAMLVSIGCLSLAWALHQITPAQADLAQQQHGAAPALNQ